MYVETPVSTKSQKGNEKPLRAGGEAAAGASAGWAYTPADLLLSSGVSKKLLHFVPLRLCSPGRPA
jgi:hypothetical protein